MITNENFISLGLVQLQNFAELSAPSIKSLGESTNVFEIKEIHSEFKFIHQILVFKNHRSCSVNFHLNMEGILINKQQQKTIRSQIIVTFMLMTSGCKLLISVILINSFPP